MRNLVIQVLAIAIGGVGILTLAWWLSGPPADELVVYPATCVNNHQILPPGLALRLETFEDSFAKYESERENCIILPWPQQVYKLNSNLGEVYYAYDFDVKKLVNCAIFSRTDWKCSYSDGSGVVVILNGLRAIHADDIEETNRFYLRRWQWWFVTLYRLIGHPQGVWLIPEQVQYIGPKS